MSQCSRMSPERIRRYCERERTLYGQPCRASTKRHRSPNSAADPPAADTVRRSPARKIVERRRRCAARHARRRSGRRRPNVSYSRRAWLEDKRGLRNRDNVAPTESSPDARTEVAVAEGGHGRTLILLGFRELHPLGVAYMVCRADISVDAPRQRHPNDQSRSASVRDLVHPLLHCVPHPRNGHCVRASSRSE
jgi:hypothetical protein